jgi:hypothetical protein
MNTKELVHRFHHVVRSCYMLFLNLSALKFAISVTCSMKLFFRMTVYRFDTFVILPSSVILKYRKSREINHSSRELC